MSRSSNRIHHDRNADRRRTEAWWCDFLWIWRAIRVDLQHQETMRKLEALGVKLQDLEWSVKDA